MQGGDSSEEVLEKATLLLGCWDEFILLFLRPRPSHDFASQFSSIEGFHVATTMKMHHQFMLSNHLLTCWTFKKHLACFIPMNSMRPCLVERRRPVRIRTETNTSVNKTMKQPKPRNTPDGGGFCSSLISCTIWLLGESRCA